MSGGGGRTNHKAGRLVLGAVLVALWVAPAWSQEVTPPDPPEVEEVEADGEEGPTEGEDIGADEADDAAEPSGDAALPIIEPVQPSEPAPEAGEDQSDADRELVEISRSDLAAQERMADAAQWAVGVAIAAAAITLAGVILVARTLAYTRDAARHTETMAREATKATKAALAATKQAKRQADLTERSFNRIQRPYLYIYGVSHIETQGSIEPGPGGPYVTYTVANFGRTPATIRILAAGISTHPKEPTGTVTVDYRDNPGHDLIRRPVLPPGDIREAIKLHAPEGIAFNPPDRNPVVLFTGPDTLSPRLSNDDQFFVWIRIQYRGPFGDGYATTACWRYDRLTNRLVQWGEQEYNGMI